MEDLTGWKIENFFGGEQLLKVVEVISCLFGIVQYHQKSSIQVFKGSNNFKVQTRTYQTF